MHLLPASLPYSNFYYCFKMEVGGGTHWGQAPRALMPTDLLFSFVYRWAPISIPFPLRLTAREHSKPTRRSLLRARGPCGWATTPTPKAFLTQKIPEGLTFLAPTHMTLPHFYAGSFQLGPQSQALDSLFSVRVPLFRLANTSLP